MFSFFLGEYPDSLIDPTLGYPLSKLHIALSSILSIRLHLIKILAIHRVVQHKNPFYPPKPFETDKAEALVDVIFHVTTLDHFEVQNRLNSKLDLFESLFQIKAIAVQPDPCKKYLCPSGIKVLVLLAYLLYFETQTWNICELVINKYSKMSVTDINNRPERDCYLSNRNISFTISHVVSVHSS